MGKKKRRTRRVKATLRKKKVATLTGGQKLDERTPEQVVRADGVYSQMYAITVPMPGAPSGFGVIEIHQNKNRADKAARLYEALFDHVVVRDIDAVLKIAIITQTWVHKGVKGGSPSKIVMKIESRIADGTTGS